jgi:hypothetical protein
MTIEIIKGQDNAVAAFFSATTQTPETDSAWDKYINFPYSNGAGDLRILAQRLERERDEWRKKYKLSVDAVEIAARLARAESERDEAREQLRIAVGLLSTQPQFADKHPEDVLDFVKEGAK